MYKVIERLVLAKSVQIRLDNPASRIPSQSSYLSSDSLPLKRECAVGNRQQAQQKICRHKSFFGSLFLKTKSLTSPDTSKCKTLAISSTKSTAATSRIFCVATLSLQCSVRISLVGFLTPLGIPVHSFLWLSDAYVQRPYFLLSLSLWFPLTCGSHTDLLLPVDMPSLCQTVVTHLANKCSCNWSAFNLRGAEEETRGLVCTAARNSLSHFLGNQGAGSKEG